MKNQKLEKLTAKGLGRRTLRRGQTEVAIICRLTEREVRPT